MKRIAAVFLMAAACRAGPAPLRLGTTYTVEQSGALAVLESLWTGPAPLTAVVTPSGQILRAAANGDLDVVITHAPALEQRLLVGPGHALLSCPLAASRFALVGPAADPAPPCHRRSRAYQPLYVVRGAPPGAASRRPGLRDVGDARRAGGTAGAAAPRRHAGVRAATGRVRRYGETVREYPAGERT